MVRSNPNFVTGQNFTFPGKVIAHGILSKQAKNITERLHAL